MQCILAYAIKHCPILYYYGICVFCISMDVEYFIDILEFIKKIKHQKFVIWLYKENVITFFFIHMYIIIYIIKLLYYCSILSETELFCTRTAPLSRHPIRFTSTLILHRNNVRRVQRVKSFFLFRNKIYNFYLC